MFSNDKVKEVVEQTQNILAQMILQARTPDQNVYVDSAFMELKTIVDPSSYKGLTLPKIYPGKVKLTFECTISTEWLQNSVLLKNIRS